MAAQPFIGLPAWIEKDRHVRDVLHDAGDHMGQQVLAAVIPDGDIDVQAAARMAGKGLRRKIRRQTAAHGDGLHHRAEGHRMVRRRERVGIAEIDLILPRALLMVGAFRLDAKLPQRQADLPADIFTFVGRGDVHIARVVIGAAGGVAAFVGFEQVKLHLCAKGEGDPSLLRFTDGVFQQITGVGVQNRAVRVGDVAEHPHHPAAFRTPGQLGQCHGVGPQQKVRADLAAEARNGGRVDGDAAFKGALQLAGHHGDVFLSAEHITEGQPDELDILLLNILQDLCRGELHHRDPPFIGW